jgi:hypothetical protein
LFSLPYLCKTNNDKQLETMARFILDYNTSLNKDTKTIIINNCRPSMVSPNGDSVQYCLVDVIDFLTKELTHEHLIGELDDLVEDIEFLNELNSESVDYIEICL